MDRVSINGFELGRLRFTAVTLNPQGQRDIRLCFTGIQSLFSCINIHFHWALYFCALAFFRGHISAEGELRLECFDQRCSSAKLVWRYYWHLQWFPSAEWALRWWWSCCHTHTHVGQWDDAALLFCSTAHMKFDFSHHSAFIRQIAVGDEEVDVCRNCKNNITYQWAETEVHLGDVVLMKFMCSSANLCCTLPPSSGEMKGQLKRL